MLSVSRHAKSGLRGNSSSFDPSPRFAVVVCIPHSVGERGQDPASRNACFRWANCPAGRLCALGIRGLDDGEWQPKLGCIWMWVDVVGKTAQDGDTSELEVDHKGCGGRVPTREIAAFFRRSSRAPELRKRTAVGIARDALELRLSAQRPRGAWYRGCGRSDWTQVDALHRDSSIKI